MPEVRQSVPTAMPQKTENGNFRTRANSSPPKKATLNVYDFPTLTRCDRSENDLDSSFTGGVASVENTWIDKRDLSHRYFLFFHITSVLWWKKERTLCPSPWTFCVRFLRRMIIRLHSGHIPTSYMEFSVKKCFLNLFKQSYGIILVLYLSSALLRGR